MYQKFILFAIIMLSTLTACAGAIDKNAVVSSMETVSSLVEDKNATSSSNEAKPVVFVSGVSIESLGYTVSLSNMIEFTEKDNMPSNTLENFSSVMLCGETMRESFIPGIVGDSSVLTVDVPFINGAYQIPSLCLQGFQNEELNHESTRIKIGDQTYRPEELERYLIWKDSEITIFNILPLVQSGTFPERLQNFVDTESKTLQEQKVAYEIALENYLWAPQVDEYLRTNISSLISKAT